MRLFFINCLLLASIAVSARPQARDIAYFTNLIKAGMRRNTQFTPAVETKSDYNLFRLPGYDDILIKIIPKPNHPEYIVYPRVTPANINAFRKVVGTKTNNDTFEAIRNVNNLLSYQILDEKQDDVMKNSAVAVFPALNNGAYVGTGRPTSESTPIIENKQPVHKTTPKPDKKKVVPEKAQVQALTEPQYTYVPMPNKPITYVPLNYPNVKVFETMKRKVGPPCVAETIDETIKLGAHPSVRERIDETIKLGENPLVRERIDETIKLGPNPLVKEVISVQAPEIVGVPLHKHGHRWQHRRFPIPVCGFGVLPHRLGFRHYKPIKHIQHMHTHSIASKPVPNHRPQLDIVDISTPKSNADDDDEDIGSKIDTRKDVELSETLGPLPPQYISHATSKEDVEVSQSKEPTHQANDGNIISSKDNVANEQIPSHVYKEQINPITGTVPVGTALEINAKMNYDSRKNPHYYYFVPPVIHKQHNSHHHKHHTEEKHGVHKNKVTAKPPSVTESFMTFSTSAPKEEPMKDNEPTSSKQVPVARPFLKNYVYLQHNADGSLITTEENQDGVTVAVDVKRNHKNRGDIPDDK